MKTTHSKTALVTLIGGVGMVIGAGMTATMFYSGYACWIFLAGAIAYIIPRAEIPTTPGQTTLTRLYRIRALAGILFIVAGILMADTAHGFFRSLFSNLYTYYETLYNKWVLPLLIAAILEIYTTLRIDAELKKH